MVRIVYLPEGKDVSDYLSVHSPQELKALMLGVALKGIKKGNGK